MSLIFALEEQKIGEAKQFFQGREGLFRIPTLVCLDCNLVNVPLYQFAFGANSNR